jgi:hypothetical protein
LVSDYKEWQMANSHRGWVLPLMAAGALVLSSQAALTGAASAAVTTGSGSGAASAATHGFTGSGLTADGAVTALKSTTGRLARSDRALLRRTDSRPVNVLVKLDYDATASYMGSVRGLDATSPRVTGRKLTGGSAAETA